MIPRAQLLQFMEEYAPRELAEPWDNVGMLVDCGNPSFGKLLLALDLTPDTAAQAVQAGADLVITHHPIFFEPVRRLSVDDINCRAAMTLVKNGICHFAAHTNLDSCKHGVNALLCDALGIKDHRALGPNSAQDTGLERIGSIAACTLEQLCKNVKSALDAGAVQCVGDLKSVIERVAVSSGAGAGCFMEAKAMGAQALITGEMKYNTALDASFEGMAIIAAGHFESEVLAMKGLFEGLQRRFNQVEYKTAFILARQYRAIQSV